MIIKTAEFVISNSDYKKCPVPEIPEYAFIGRSNVGKSSLINAMVNQKYLAKTSGKPGKTQLIWFIYFEYFTGNGNGFVWIEEGNTGTNCPVGFDTCGM